jgi:putative heme-binding domain-containing protein
LLGPLAAVVGARRRPDELGRVLAALGAREAAGPHPDLVAALGRAVEQSGGRLDALVANQPAARGLLDALVAEALKTAADPDAAVAKRQRAIELLACASFPKLREPLTALLDIHQPAPIQIAAIRALSGHDEPAVASLLLDRFRSFTPDVRAEAIAALMARESRTVVFLDAVQADPTLAAQLDPTQRSALRNHPSEKVRVRAGRLLGPSFGTSRQEVIAAYQPALKEPSDPLRGRSVFERECALCHKLGATGHAVGPDLTSSTQRDAEALLVHILDPNAYVLPNWSQYQVVTKDGRIVSGLLATQSASSVTLKREEDRTETIPRAEIEDLVGTGQSLMPEGFETQIDPRAMADLIAFLQAHQAAVPVSEPLDVGTLPGLIEPSRPNPP